MTRVAKKLYQNGVTSAHFCRVLSLVCTLSQIYLYFSDVWGGSSCRPMNSFPLCDHRFISPLYHTELFKVYLKGEEITGRRGICSELEWVRRGGVGEKSEFISSCVYRMIESTPLFCHSSWCPRCWKKGHWIDRQIRFTLEEQECGF